MMIWFDMDGTIANLYGVYGWLNYLKAQDPTPYKTAQPLINMNSLARCLNKLQQQGIQIGIISWLAKNSTKEYDEKVAYAKKTWLKKHLHSVHFNEIHIVKYGTPKENFIITCEDLLFDDEEKNRNNWTGFAFDEKNILKTLRTFY